ncbi:MAG: glycerophosphodiester phosphodiesterase [Clostridiales bacterium]|nr:glycerophosphodiester phosphodiesterase [Clostridiales bacterium]
MNGIEEAIIIIICIIAGCSALFLAMTCPGRGRRERMKPFENVLIAHRGLFDNQGDAPENTMAAFRKAIDAGFAIELDVQMSSDGQLLVFHDPDLKRLAGVDLKVCDTPYEILVSYPLGQSEERIPLFADVLDLVAGQVPMVVEIKISSAYRKTTRAAAAMLQSYQGIYCVESFHPLSLFWYRRHMPQILRGQLSMDFKYCEEKVPMLVKIFMTNLWFNFISKPDFIAYNHKDKRKRGFFVCRRIFHAKTAAWTIKSQQELVQARDMFDMFIFDSFMPDPDPATDSCSK